MRLVEDAAGANGKNAKPGAQMVSTQTQSNQQLICKVAHFLSSWPFRWQNHFRGKYKIVFLVFFLRPVHSGSEVLCSFVSYGCDGSKIQINVECFSCHPGQITNHPLLGIVSGSSVSVGAQPRQTGFIQPC